MAEPATLILGSSLPPDERSPQPRFLPDGTSLRAETFGESTPRRVQVDNLKLGARKQAILLA